MSTSGSSVDQDTVSGSDPRAAGAGPPDTGDAEPELRASADVNRVHLIGRVSGAPDRRTLPSGDEVVVLRVVVRRPEVGVDTLDVSVGPAPPAGGRPRAGQVGRRLLAVADRFEDGARVEVRGSLRRRWWGNGGRRQSRVEVRAEELAAHGP